MTDVTIVTAPAEADTPPAPAVIEEPATSENDVAIAEVEAAAAVAIAQVNADVERERIQVFADQNEEIQWLRMRISEQEGELSTLRASQSPPPSEQLPPVEVTAETAIVLDSETAQELSSTPEFTAEASEQTALGETSEEVAVELPPLVEIPVRRGGFRLV